MLMTGKGTKPLHLAFVSDIHLCHSRVSSKNILKSLKAAFPDNRETGALDAIFIGGDLFDQVAHLSDADVQAIELWMADLLSVCKRWNIILRVLEGTPSHDRGQSVLFETINTITGIQADCKYVDTLSIERMESLGLDVLYVPDEWRMDPEDTWQDVQAVLLQHGLDSVDYAIMHGMFEFQLPTNVVLPCHDSERYQSIVKRYISMGHHHAARFHGRIFAQGSLDRLAHGEEGAKGHVRVTDYGCKDHAGDEIVFVENPHATRFVTYEGEALSDERVEETLKEAGSLPPGSHVRFTVPRNDACLPLLQAFKHNAPLIHCTFKYLKSEEAAQFKPVLGQTFTPTPLGRNDAEALMANRLAQKGVEAHLSQNALALLRAHL
jgi:hypothetical protein